MIIELNSEKTITVGIVSDTHIPDRVNRLHPQLLPILRQLKVDYLFHCGDLSQGRVVTDLMAIAPVYAVRGNRDFMLRATLPMMRLFIINGVRTLLAHGHLNPVVYWKDKVRNLLYGYQLTRYVSRLSALDTAASVYVFGHSHHAENIWQEGKLFFNPGGSSVGHPIASDTSMGVIRYQPDGLVHGEIIKLTGHVIKFRQWEQHQF
jgi:putative phosphoesterase